MRDLIAKALKLVSPSQIPVFISVQKLVIASDRLAKMAHQVNFLELQYGTRNAVSGTFPRCFLSQMTVQLSIWLCKKS